MGDRQKLLEVLRTAAASLPNVHEQKMFGCEALFTNERIFALVWKAGRIGLKLPAPDRYAVLAAQKGAEPWSAGTRTMTSWVLVPSKLESAKTLAPWLAEAHAMATAWEGPAAKPKKKAAPKKVAAPKKKLAARATKKVAKKK